MVIKSTKNTKTYIYSMYMFILDYQQKVIKAILHKQLS